MMSVKFAYSNLEFITIVFVFQQQNQMRERIFTLSHKLSAMSFGQDRHRRRYWVLPKCGGILVEGLESGEPESADPKAPETDRKVVESVDQDQCFKPVSPPNGEVEGSTVKAENVESDSSAENKLKTDDVTVQPLLGNSTDTPELPDCDKVALNCNDDKAESVLVKQEDENTESSHSGTLKAELVSLNCLIGTDVKVNGDVSMMDCKNGFVDLKSCIRSDGDCIKVEPLPSSTVSDTKRGTLADDSSSSMKSEIPAVHTQTISVTPNPPESATNDSVQSSLCCQLEDDQRPSKDDISFLHHSSMLQLAMSNAGLTQFGVTSSQSYSVASSQRTSQVATPSSELGATSQLDLSTAGTPISFMQPSRTSTPAYLSTSFADDLQLDGELQPDYLAVPQNVEPISLGILLFASVTGCKYVRQLVKLNQRERNLSMNLSKLLFFASTRFYYASQYIYFLYIAVF